ncbi:hypothetical protein HHI36_022628 [Cryptolaemus montrouzieri]|uniref:C2H2-type domain-containing protein n=1 Tax=Cryptolaemus montrouzieri TaxID=559131 RepID=A0ABD2N0H6_9CUCU
MNTIASRSSSFGDSVKEEIVQEEVSTNENHVKSTLGKAKYCKCTQCYYRTRYKCTMELHINSVHLGIKNHKCTLCDFQTATKSNIIKIANILAKEITNVAIVIM